MTVLLTALALLVLGAVLGLPGRLLVLMLAILWGGVLKRGSPFGAARKVASVTESQRVVCFSETPFGFLDRLVERRGTRYGICFHKRFLQDQGAAPIWYIGFGTPQHRALRSMMEAAERRGAGPDDPIWQITPFIDITGDGASAPYRYEFEWEREWRAARDIHFSEADVAALLIPEELHAAARGFFQDAIDENTGPGYLCPYLDPTWSLERVRQAVEDQRGRLSSDRRARVRR